jgi:hypothetical protein
VSDIACNCGGKSKTAKPVKYVVKYKDGTSETFDAVGPAQRAAMQRKGSMRVMQG